LEEVEEKRDVINVGVLAPGKNSTKTEISWRLQQQESQLAGLLKNKKKKEDGKIAQEPRSMV